jgi:hypothetical protein
MTPTLCHPERSLVESEANRQTESKDPASADVITGNARNFRIVVRFFDDHEYEQFASREAALTSTARKCRVSVPQHAGLAETAPSSRGQQERK